MSDINKELDIEAPVIWANNELSWIGRSIFWLSVTGGFGLFVCLIWRWRLGAHWFGASSSQIAFFGALWVGALALALWGRVGSQMQTNLGLSDQPTTVSAASLMSNLFAQPWAPWLTIAATLALSIAFVYWGKVRETQNLQQQILPRDQAATAGVWLPKLTTLAWSLVFISTIFWFAVSGGGADTPIARMVWIGCSLLALSLSLWQIERDKSADKPRFRWALVGALCGLLSLGLAAQFGLNDNDIASYAAGTSLLLALAILIYLAANSRGWRATLPRAIAVALQTLGGVAATCAVIFLMASLAALPVRARQNRIVDDYIARGEIDWMRNQPEIRRAAGNQS